MPVPSSINDLSTTPGANSPSGSESPATFDDYVRTHAAFIAQLRDGKASSSDAVLLTGNQTVNGVKTFAQPIVGSLNGNASGLSSPLGISSGGTGQTTAAAAFNAIKQAATTSATGVVQSANDAEAQAATALNRHLTASNLSAVLLGVNQTRTNVLASRSLGVNFTNNTGRLIEVTVTAIVPSATTFTLELGGTTVVQSAGTAEQRTHFFTVRNGETYRLGGAVTLVSWYELR